MTDQTASNLKNALVASLFELANAAQNTATATVNLVSHYNLNPDSASNASLVYLAQTLSAVNGASAAAGGLASAPPTASTTKSSSKNGTAAAPAPTAAPTKTSEPETPSQPATQKEQSPEPVPESELASQPELSAYAKKKQAKLDRDPNAPKKPLTMYFAWSFEAREKLKEERKKNGLEPLSAVDMNGIIKDKWAAITAEEKDKWQQKYREQYIDYQRAKDEYDAKKNGDATPVAEVIASESDATPAPPVETPKKSESSSKKSKSSKVQVHDTQNSDATADSESSKKSKKRKDKDSSEKKAKKSKKSKDQA